MRCSGSTSLLRAPGAVSGNIEPAVSCVAPTPALFSAAPSPVVDYITPAPSIENVAPSPAVASPLALSEKSGSTSRVLLQAAEEEGRAAGSSAGQSWESGLRGSRVSCCFGAGSSGDASGWECLPSCWTLKGSWKTTKCQWWSWKDQW